MKYTKVMNDNKNCLIYTRVSTTKQAQQGESPKDQELVCRNIADREKLSVLKVFNEQFSGRKEERPVIDEVFSYIKKSPKKVDVLIVRAIDRFTRNGTYGYEALKQQLARLGVQLLDSYGMIQPSKNTLEHLNVEYSWSTINPSETTELIMAQQGKSEVNQILTRMIGAEINLVREGYKVRQANDGFLNQKIYVDGKKRVIQVPDPARANFYIKMYEMRANGTYSDQEIVDHINAMGYRSNKRNVWSKDKIIGTKGAKMLTVKQLQKVIQKPIYCGINTEKWLEKPIKTSYKGLVSIELFNSANRGKVFIEELKDEEIKVHHDYDLSKLKRMKDNPLFPFKEVVLCPECLEAKPFLGSSPKGKSGKTFPTYHCARGHKYYGVPKSELEKKLTEFVGGLKYGDKFMKSFEATLLNKFREKEKELGEFSVQVGTTVIELETTKKQKLDAYTSTQSKVIRSELEKEIESIHEQIEKTRKQRNNLEVQENDIHSFIKYVKTLMEHPIEMLIKQRNPLILKSLYSLVFDELPTYKEIVSGTPKLSLAYRLSQEFDEQKAPVVTSRRIELRLQA